MLKLYIKIKHNLLKRSNLEYLIPLLGVISLIISCIIISSKKYFWNDELYSYHFLSDASFVHMLSAFHDKINNTPILYFLLGWCWDTVFGSSEISLRLFSSLGMCTALMVVWVTLRKSYDFWATSIGTLGVFCTSQIILDQNAEARMYGLFLALCALAFYNYENIGVNNQNISNRRTATFIIHVLIIHSHLFGLFYSGGVLAAFIMRDLFFNKFNPKNYLTIIISWFSFVFYIPSFLKQSDAGNPRTWIPIPTLNDLFDFLSLSSSSLLNLLVLYAIILIAGLQILIHTKFGNFAKNLILKTNSTYKISSLIFAYIFVTIPIFIWLFSKIIKPIFWERYMISSTIGWAVIVSYVSSILLAYPFRALKNASSIKSILVNIQGRVLRAALMLVLLINPVRFAYSIPRELYPGSTDNIFGYGNLPIVAQDSHQFMRRIHYSPQQSRYYFLLDWEAAIDEKSGQFSPQEYKHMEAFKRTYPDTFNNNILSSQKFLAKYERFLVIDYADYTRKCPLHAIGIHNWQDIHCPQWVEIRLLNNDNYKVTHLGDIWTETILLVEKQK